VALRAHSCSLLLSWSDVYEDVHNSKACFVAEISSCCRQDRVEQDARWSRMHAGAHVCGSLLHGDTVNEYACKTTILLQHMQALTPAAAELRFHCSHPCLRNLCVLLGLTCLRSSNANRKTRTIVSGCNALRWPAADNLVMPRTPVRSDRGRLGGQHQRAYRLWWCTAKAFMYLTMQPSSLAQAAAPCPAPWG